MSARRRTLIRRPAHQWHSALRAGLFILVLTTVLSAVLAFQFWPSAYQVNEGEISRTNIKSPQRVVYVSEVRTQEERERAAAAVPDQYSRDAGAQASARQEAADALRRIGEIRQDTATMEQKRANIGKLSIVTLPANVVSDLMAFNEEAWQATASSAARLVDATMSATIVASQITDVKAQLTVPVEYGLTSVQAGVAAALARSFVKPNVTPDIAASTRAREAAKAAVPPVRLTIEEGEMILREGDRVKATDIEKLQAAGLRVAALRWSDLSSIVLLTALLATLLGAYVYFFQADLLLNARRTLLLILLIAAAIFFARLVIPGREFYAYGFPLATTPMLVATLLDPALALAVTLTIAPLFAMIGGHSLELATIALAGSFVGLIGAWRLERLNGLFFTGLGIAAANFAVMMGFQLSTGELTVARVGLLAFLALANGALCGALTLGHLSVLGHIFGITTTIGLLELAHPSQPLFRRLLTDAPGTYHHSVIVANLAERAAHEIGADAMLARVGAYYHDIGKVVHPFHFIENQMNGVNIHDELDPANSAQLVIAHVKDGLVLAKRHGLPAKVRDIVEQHHGRSAASYFYARACRNNEIGVDAEAFRYPGPRPQTVEAAIVMLADSVEATVRSSRDHSPEQIEQLIEQTINARLADGQLAECDLTLRDLDHIRRAFGSVLQGMFHPRIEYPETERSPRTPLRLLDRVGAGARSRLRGGKL